MKTVLAACGRGLKDISPKGSNFKALLDENVVIEYLAT